MSIEKDIGLGIEIHVIQRVRLDNIVEMSSITSQIYTGRSQDMLELARGQYLQVKVVSHPAMHLSKAEELHIVRTPDRDSVANVLSVDTLDRSAVGGLGVAALGGVGLGALGLVVVVAEDTGPLLHGLLVVGGTQGGVGAAVVDLHLGAGAGEAGVH
jgi:hypothetical protein